MNGLRILATLLIGVGTLGLVYGEFSDNNSAPSTTFATFELSLKKQQTLNVPLSAGVSAIALGAILLMLRSKRVVV